MTRWRPTDRLFSPARNIAAPARMLRAERHVVPARAVTPRRKVAPMNRTAFLLVKVLNSGRSRLPAYCGTQAAPLARGAAAERLAARARRGVGAAAPER